ncbi:hypothetical protein C8F01DRAFT_21785 [Mycena amicta]|nr:hypothetical protein C8F01DRAFT_21785 [Mycena amicta]
MWEELAFYEGFARTWQALYYRNDDRTAHHIRHLLQLIEQFPQVNPSGSRLRARHPQALSSNSIPLSRTLCFTRCEIRPCTSPCRCGTTRRVRVSKLGLEIGKPSPNHVVLDTCTIQGY